MSDGKTFMLKRFWLLPLFILLLGNAEFEALFAPDADLLPRWAAHDATSKKIVDHDDWDRFLGRFRVVGPDGIARVDYKAVPPDEKALLDRYLERIQDISVTTLNRPQQFAYWINLYNALTVQIVLEHYPVESIQDIDISPGLFTSGPWDADLATVEGAPLTLNDIEHRILRPIWADPRIHYVVNCASLGCPDLPERAITATNWEEMLDMAARDYINHPRAVAVDGDKLRLSSIYAWYEEDFSDDLEGHINRYRKEAIPPDLIRVYSYNWDLNDLREK